MAKEHESPDKGNETAKKRPALHTASVIILVSTILIVLCGALMLVNNNVSLTSDEAFASQVDAAINSAEKWVSSNREDILKKKNIGLLKMLRECNQIKPNPVFEEIVKSFLAVRSQPECWKRLVDPNWPVNAQELNRAVENENIDNKWTLYAIAPEKAKITPEEMQLFEPERWSGRKLSHQLDALTTLRQTKGSTEQLDKLIEHICDRVSNELSFDVLKVDIGQVGFILRAGFPEKIRRRWVERIAFNQLPDGGWNKRRSCFVLGRRSLFGFHLPSGNQHDTILALTVLYLVKYQYPEHFGLTH
jgi:hypothetical protein